MNIFYQIDKENTEISSNNYIKLYLHAGLCNQLFMIFATISTAIDYNLKYIFYSKENITIDNGNKVYWNTFLDKFKNNITDNIDASISLYQEKNFHYDKIPYIYKGFNLKGYFQSEKYFKHNYNKILEIMDFNNKQNIVKNKYNKLFNKKTIAVHFRIGDYMGLQFNHPIMKPIYYENAFNFLEKKLQNIKDEYDILYFCQSTDNNIVDNYISIINKNKGYNFVKVPDDIVDWEQLLIMSLCDNFIIANSTFSWFGAYFCKNEKKIIIYPSVWFGENLKHNNTNDICPEEWIKIDAL